MQVVPLIQAMVKKLNGTRPQRTKTGKFGVLEGKIFVKTNVHDQHHDRRIQKRPEYAEGHVAVPDPEILQNQVFHDEAEITLPHEATIPS